ncbi:MAG: hypothetical protein AAFP16_03430, partial [Pseudomonadota bacterium]
LSRIGCADALPGRRAPPLAARWFKSPPRHHRSLFSKEERPVWWTGFKILVPKAPAKGPGAGIMDVPR